MEYVSRNMEQTLELSGLLDTPKSNPPKKKRWNLFFIDDHGRVISFQQIRWLLVLLPIVLLVLMSFIVCTYFLHKGIKIQNSNLQNAIELSQQELKAMQQKMPALMLRLAEAQSRPPKDSVLKDSKFTAKTSIGSKTANQPDQKDRETEKAASVSDFSAFYNSELNELNVQFIIRNTNRASPDLSGYIFVIMKQNDHDQKGWFPIPAVELVSGTPSLINSGQFFKIRNYKIAKFHSSKIVGPRNFNKAAVLLFSPTGELFHEEIFFVNITVPEIPVEANGAGTVAEKSVGDFLKQNKSEMGFIKKKIGVDALTDERFVTEVTLK